MKKSHHTNYKLKNAVNKLLTPNPLDDPPTRKTLMNQLKNIILTNKQLNHRCMDFNFAKEYKQMHRTMTRFNSEQNNRKNLVSRLSKENEFFTRSYPNMISSLAINIDQLNINCETISNFNQKFELKSASTKENNFFYEDPLLLTKSKDLDNFYINENITSTKNDLSLLYSKKLLLDIHSNSPLNRVIKIIEKSSPKKPQFSDMFKNNYNNLTERNYSNNNMITKNINIENQSLSDRNINIFRNKQKINTPKYPDINTINPEEIKQLKKYNKSIKKLLKGNVPDRTYTQKNLNILKYSSLFNNNGRNSCKKNEKKRSIKVYSQSNDKKANSKNNAVSSSKNLKNILPKKQIKIDLLKLDDMSNNNIYKDIDKYLPKRSKLQKTIKKKILKMKQLKGSIHIQNIYKDLVKTKETIHEYEKERQPKFKYLYSLFNDKNLLPFQKEEKENLNIKKLDRDLFWTVNEFHNN
jgi:hypothetical protein